MIWRRCSVIAPQRTGEIGFGCRKKPAGKGPLTIEHNPYEIPSIFYPWNRYVKIALLCLAVNNFFVLNPDKIYNSAPPLAATLGLFFGFWLQQHTGGYVHYHQIPRITRNAIRQFFR